MGELGFWPSHSGSQVHALNHQGHWPLLILLLHISASCLLVLRSPFRTCTSFPSVSFISPKTSLPKRLLFTLPFLVPLSICFYCLIVSIRRGWKSKYFKQLRRHIQTYLKQCLPCWGTNVFLLSVKVNMQMLKFLERKRGIVT